MERIYKTMRNVGAWNIAIGVVMIVTGIVTGVMAIVGGARLLHKKRELTF